MTTAQQTKLSALKAEIKRREADIPVMVSDVGIDSEAMCFYAQIEPTNGHGRRKSLCAEWEVDPADAPKQVEWFIRALKAEKPMTPTVTNFARITASPEALATFLDDRFVCCLKVCNRSPESCGCSCQPEVLAWLNGPSEVEAADGCGGYKDDEEGPSMKCGACASANASVRVWQERNNYVGELICEYCNLKVSAYGDSLQEVLNNLELEMANCG